MQSNESLELDLEIPDDAENESDLRQLSAEQFQRTQVTDTDWTTETILAQLGKGNIDLNPRFQRRDAWDDERKSKFIESLILGLPIPQIVLAESKERRGTFIVIDGKQRLLALQKFAQSERTDPRKPLRLRGLTQLPDLNDCVFSDLQSTAKLTHYLPIFENQTIRTTVIRGWSDEDLLYTIFYRLNSGSLPLSPQELRHVLHPGPFVDFAFDFTERSKAIGSLVGVKSGPDFRMRDVELLIRFLGLKFFLNQYSGDLKSFLDQTSLSLNRDWDVMHPKAAIPWNGLVKDAAQELELAIQAVQEIFDEKKWFRKYTDSQYENRFNRAVFDIFTYYLAEPSIRKASLERPDQIRDVFERLCLGDGDFRRSIEVTTKSPKATFTRLFVFGAALQDVLGTKLTRLEEPERLYRAVKKQ